MKHVGFVLLLAVLYLGLRAYLDHTRFTIVATQPGVAYKLDRKTGHVWFLRGDSPERPIKSAAEVEAEQRQHNLDFEEWEAGQQRRLAESERLLDEIEGRSTVPR